MLNPIATQLQQGISPKKIAITIALGFTLGIFPILGSTTLLCALAAFLFHLNQPIILVTSYFAYPLQFALLIPFYRAGESLFRQPHQSLSIPLLISEFKSHPLHFLQSFGIIGLEGIAVWLLLPPPLPLLLYFLLLHPLRLLALRSL
ncbi:MAG: DUF2062 domain-containing protein [Verrucomicrobia bacterium]|nr:DUF2062 domain-containing protein [Verrucomicrobiota bacterium]